MKKQKIILGFVFLLFLFGCWMAHNPRLVYKSEIRPDKPIQIVNPEISQAFYGNLRWNSDYYQIKSETWFNLFVSIVVPTISWARTDFQVVVLDNKANIIKILDWTNTKRTNFWERFAWDMYWDGPEFEKFVSSGTYTIIVSNIDNQWKYSLAVGKIEKFTIKDMVNTIKSMPALKTDFFEKSVWTTFFNFVWIFVLLFIITLFTIIWLLNIIIKKLFWKNFKKRKETKNYQKTNKKNKF